MPETMVNVRYMVDDVEAAVAWYTQHLGFVVISSAAPAFADVKRGSLQLLLSGPKSSAGRAMADGAARARRLESHSLRRGRPCRRDRAAARSRRDIPERDGQRARRLADPVAGSVGKSGRAVSAAWQIGQSRDDVCANAVLPMRRSRFDQAQGGVALAA